MYILIYIHVDIDIHKNVTYLIVIINLWGKFCHVPCFTEKETEAREVKKLDPQSIHGGTRIQTWRSSPSIIFSFASKILSILGIKHLLEEYKANSHYMALYPTAHCIRVRIACHNFLKILRKK